MYTPQELNLAAKSISQIAESHGVPESEVRAEMRLAILEAMKSEDSAVQARWQTCECKRDAPTEEEFISWIVRLIRTGQSKTIIADYDEEYNNSQPNPMPEMR